jgi:hypothetical protein
MHPIHLLAQEAATGAKDGWFNYPQGLIAVLLAIICFYGMTYVVVALNTGWRFGYWICGAAFGALMVMLSIFWLVNPVGPQGNAASWVPVASARTNIAQASYNNESLSAPAQYPTGPWQEPNDVQRASALTSAVQTCITAVPAQFTAQQKKPCGDAQSLMPPEKTIPVINGTAVAVQTLPTNIKFANDHGLLAEVTVTPTTHDPRVASDPKTGKVMGPSFVMLFIYDYGALRLPPLMSLVIFSIFFLIHITGLNRAEKRKLNPTMVS